MKQIQADLWETAVESPFPGLTTHAYLLQRRDGNVLFYNTGHAQEIDAIAPLGGWHTTASATGTNWETPCASSAIAMAPNWFATAWRARTARPTASRTTFSISASTGCTTSK